MNKKLLVLFAIFLSSNGIFSIELKGMSVYSSVDESFNATIEFIASEEIDDSKITLENSIKSFNKNPNLIDINTLEFGIKKIDGKSFITLNSSSPLNKSQYDFNVTIKEEAMARKARYFGFVAPRRGPKATKENIAVNDLSSCLNLLQASERLECYDKSLSRKKRNNDQKFTVASTAEMPKEKMIVEEDLFGKKGDDLEEVKAKTQKIVIPNRLDTVIEKITRYAADKYILTLGNGQKWKLLEPTRKGLFKVEQTVSISKGLFGSYDLNIQNLNKKYRVKREE